MTLASFVFQRSTRWTPSPSNQRRINSWCHLRKWETEKKQQTYAKQKLWAVRKPPSTATQFGQPSNQDLEIPERGGVLSAWGLANKLQFLQLSSQLFSLSPCTESQNTSDSSPPLFSAFLLKARRWATSNRSDHIHCLFFEFVPWQSSHISRNHLH